MAPVTRINLFLPEGAIIKCLVYAIVYRKKWKLFMRTGSASLGKMVSLSPATFYDPIMVQFFYSNLQQAGDCGIYILQ